MSEEAPRANSFWEMIRWDGCLPLFVLGSRGVLALCFGGAGATAVACVLISPAVALARTQIANRQIARLGVRRGYDRQICIAGAIVAVMLFEIIAVIMWTDGAAPLEAWMIPGALYILYLALIAIALRPPRSAKPVDAYAEYWFVRPIDK